MSHVFVLDTRRQPGDPVHPGRARLLLRSGQAAVFQRDPFTILLHRAVDQAPAPLRCKIDPGSRTTGLALVNDTTGAVVFAAEIQHRGALIKARLDARRAVRRSRRTRTLRHRAPRFRNRRRPAGWLPPSLTSRVSNVLTWVQRLRRLAPSAALSLEVVKFDTQRLQNPEIAGVEIEHIVPQSRGGSDRVSKLTLACHECNHNKDNLTTAEFGHPQIQAQAQQHIKPIWRADGYAYQYT